MEKNNYGAGGNESWPLAMNVADLLLMRSFIIIHQYSPSSKRSIPAQGSEKALAILKKISPAAWRHIHFQGHFIFSDDKIIDLDVIIGKVFLDELRKNVKQSDAKRA